MDPTVRELSAVATAIHEVAYMCDEPDEELRTLGMRGYWDGYFASRAAPLGMAPAEVVHAVFYNFAPGEVARHIPHVWTVTTPEAALAARERGCVRALQTVLGDLATGPGIVGAAETLMRAATGVRTDGRPLFAGLRTIPVPTEPLALLWHGATLLREYRGDGHNAALLAHGINGTEAHTLQALYAGMRPEEFGRIGHLRRSTLDAVAGGMRERGLVGDDGWLTGKGRATRERIEQVTDALAEPAYCSLSPDERRRLVADLRPVVAALEAANPHRG